MTIELLKTMLAEGTFHHATYRDHGKVWEGLYIYVKDADGFRGFKPAGAFNNYRPNGGADSPEMLEAEELLRQARRGVSVGSYGKG